MPLASSAEASVSPAKPVKALAVEGERDRLRPVDRGRRPRCGSAAHASSVAAGVARSGRGSPILVGRHDPVAHRVAQRVEEAPAAVDVPPALGMQALRIAAQVEESAHA
jgi:hypothetical protein